MEAELSSGFDRVAILLLEDEAEDQSFGQPPWLTVELDARIGPKAWRGSDACLRRDEAEALIAWAEAWSQGDGPGTLEFRESNLAFSIHDETLELRLDLELAPPEAEEALSLRFPLDRAQLGEMARALRGQLDAIDRQDPGPNEPLIPRPPKR